MTASGAHLPKRIVIKLSGEALMGAGAYGLDPVTLGSIADDIGALAARGVECAIVCGGGNFFRGLKGARQGIERARGDAIGMLATLMNAMALEGAFQAKGLRAMALSALAMPGHCEPYSRQKADAALKDGYVVIIGGGTGNPFFTTDTAAVLRAAELGADFVLKATQVDGVYTADPKTHPEARRYDHLTHDEAIENNLAVMDTAAFALARENGVSMLIFALRGARPISSALAGQVKATLVTPKRPANSEAIAEARS